MTAYRYRAARQDGALELGVLTAGTRAAASEALAARGLFPLELAPAREEESTRQRLATAELALGFRLLATLLESGLPMARALAVFPELAPPRWQVALPTMQAAIREGASLGAALARGPLSIPPVVIGLIAAGESGSGVAPAVRRAAELLEETAATRAAIRSALAYPLVLALAGTTSVALLVGVVLPRFGAILADLGQTLPPTTRFVLTAAHVARAGALPAGLLLVLLLALWRAWVATDAGRARWHALLLAVPALGPVRRAQATARSCAALAALVESGVPLASALRQAAPATGDAALTARLLIAREAIVVGQRPSAAFQAADVLTPVAVRLVRAGEETGRLAQMLGHAARLEREFATARVQRAVRLLEPALILIFAGLVALVAAALLQALYSVRPT
jgi:general secretion pathway protein F